MAKYKKKFFNSSSITKDKFGNTKITIDIESLQNLIDSSEMHYRTASIFIGISKHTGKPYLYYLEREDDANSYNTDSDELPF